MGQARECGQLAAREPDGGQPGIQHGRRGKPRQPDQPGQLDEPTAADSDLAADAAADTLANDPHNREYYLAQIPFTDEQVGASNDIIKDALFHAGVIFKDKLDNLRLSEKHLLRLTNNYAGLRTDGRGLVSPLPALLAAGTARDWPTTA